MNNSFITGYRERFPDDKRSDTEILLDSGSKWPKEMQQYNPDAWEQYQSIINGAMPSAQPAAEPEEEKGDFVRGAKVSLHQLPGLAMGTVGLIGATAEKVLGEGGVSTAVKDWGLKGAQESMAKEAPCTRTPTA